MATQTTGLSLKDELSAERHNLLQLTEKHLLTSFLLEDEISAHSLYSQKAQSLTRVSLDLELKIAQSKLKCSCLQAKIKNS